MLTVYKYFGRGNVSPLRSSDEIYNKSLVKKVEPHMLGTLAPLRIYFMKSGNSNIFDEVRDKCYQHFMALYSGSADFEYYEAAYRFGAELAASDLFGDKLWPIIEAEACIMWEEVNQDTWQLHQAQILHGWNIVQQERMKKAQQLVR